MARYSAEQIYAFARAAGFDPDSAATMTAIAMAESSGSSSAHATQGEDSRGLWQINARAHHDLAAEYDLWDPRDNARAAFEVSHGGRDVSAWTSTHGGARASYLRYRDDAQAAAVAHGDPDGLGVWTGTRGYGHPLAASPHPPGPDGAAHGGDHPGDGPRSGATVGDAAGSTHTTMAGMQPRSGAEIVGGFLPLHPAPDTAPGTDPAGGEPTTSPDPADLSPAAAAFPGAGQDGAVTSGQPFSSTPQPSTPEPTAPVPSTPEPSAGPAAREAVRASAPEDATGHVTTASGSPAASAFSSVEGGPAPAPVVTAARTEVSAALHHGQSRPEQSRPEPSRPEPSHAGASDHDRAGDDLTGGGHAPSPALETFLDAARAQKGDAYVFGAPVRLGDPDPSAFDCSELIRWAAHRAGVSGVPDGSWLQYLALKKEGALIPVEEARHTKGAILFSFSSEPTAGGARPSHAHVAISDGEGHTIEARGRAYGVGSWESKGRFNYAAVIPGLDGRGAAGADRGRSDVGTPDGTDAGTGGPGSGEASGATIVGDFAVVTVIDTDVDGLADDLEGRLHTDPYRADTDGDGVRDSLEIIYTHTDPLSADPRAVLDAALDDALAHALGADAGFTPDGGPGATDARPEAVPAAHHPDDTGPGHDPDHGPGHDPGHDPTDPDGAADAGAHGEAQGWAHDVWSGAAHDPSPTHGDLPGGQWWADGPDGGPHV